MSGIAEILSAVMWPAVVLVVVLLLRGPIAELISRVKDASVKAGPVEASITTQAEAPAIAAAIGKAGTTEPAAVIGIVRQAKEAVADATRDVSLSDRWVLWVDDNPAGNSFENEMLTSLGMGVVISTSTSDAIDRLRTRSFDVVISDMKRGRDDTAGLQLLKDMRARGDRMPVVFYVGNATADRIREAEAEGATGLCADPATLLHLVTQAVRTNDGYLRTVSGSRG